MLDFFRRHQRYFFICITIVVVISFSFFGTSKALRNGYNAPKASPDKILGRSLDGSPIMQREVDSMVQLISSGEENISLAHSEADFNFLTDALITKDFLETDLGSMLVAYHFEKLAPDLQARLVKMKKYRPYVHPQASFLSAESVWRHFSPSIANNFVSLTATKEADETTFGLISSFYLQQVAMPPSVLKKVLSFQQNQYTWLSPDPALMRGDLLIFGFRSAQDWFGRNFLELVSQFLINASVVAEQQGYIVSQEEARAQLFQNANKALCRMRGVDSLPSEEVEKILREKLSRMQLTEREVVRDWRRIMLFKRLFNEYGNSVFLDTLSYKKFADYSEENVLVEIYKLPEYLKLKDFRSMLRLQFYCDAVGVKSNSSDKEAVLRLPFSSISMDALKKEYPELVQRVFSVEYTKVSKHQLAQKVTLKQTWEWEISDKNWDILAQKFPVLNQKNLKTKEERFLLLESLDPTTRFKVDRLARFAIIGEHKEWIEEGLEKGTLNREVVNFRAEGGSIPFTEIKDREALLKLLTNANIQEKLQHDSESLLKLGDLAFYSQDDENFYRIAVVEKAAKDAVVPFAEVTKDGTLDALLDSFLEDQYVLVREKNSALFTDSKGSFKSFVEVKEQVAKLVYEPLLKAIEGYYKNSGLPGSLTATNFTPDFYAQHRLYKYAKEVRSSFESGEGVPLVQDSSIKGKITESDALSAQWLFVKEDKKVKRGDDLKDDKDAFFSATVGKWSGLRENLGNYTFFKVKERSPGELKVDSNVREGEKMLSLEAKRHLMHKLLQTMEERKAINLNVAVSDDKDS